MRHKIIENTVEVTNIVEEADTRPPTPRQGKIIVLRRKQQPMPEMSTILEEEDEEQFEPVTEPDTSFDAIINLFRFTREHYMDLPEKGIVNTCVETLCEKISKMTNPPFCVSDAGAVSIYYRGKWVTEKLDDIIKRRGELVTETHPILCDAIDMFIENMMLQFRRNQELHNYHSILREIENGYRTNQQIKIIKRLAAARRASVPKI